VRSKPKGAKGRNLTLVVLGLCLACGGAGKITPVMSKNSFMVEGASSDEEAKKDAISFCGRQGRTAIMSPLGRGSMARGEFMFMCASPGDPGNESPNVQPIELKPSQEK